MINNFQKKYKEYQELRKSKEIEKKKKEKKKDKEDKEDILKEKNMKITENICIIYKDRKNKKLFNGYTFEILCQLLKQDLGYTQKDILFQKFNGEKFREYYSELYKGIQEGNNYFLNCFKSIKLFYNKIHKKKFEYDKNKFIEREKNQQTFIKRCELTWTKLDNLHKFLKNMIISIKD